MTSKTEEKATQKKFARLSKSSKILKVIIEAIQDKKGEHIVTLDLRKINEAVSDFFIVCEASSTTQVKAIADWVEVSLKKECGEIPYKHEGHSAAQWILIDYVNVVVHVFLSETRKFYKLEEMWSDGISTEEEDEALVHQESVNKKAAKKSSVKEESIKKAPAKKAPVTKEPVKKAPAKKAAVAKEPVKKAPAKKAAVAKEPVKKAPAKKAAVKKESIKKAPAKKAAVAKEPIKKAPAKKASVKKSAVTKSPSKKAKK